MKIASKKDAPPLVIGAVEVPGYVDWIPLDSLELVLERKGDVAGEEEDGGGGGGDEDEIDPKLKAALEKANAEAKGSKKLSDSFKKAQIRKFEGKLAVEWKGNELVPSGKLKDRGQRAWRNKSLQSSHPGMSPTLSEQLNPPKFEAVSLSKQLDHSSAALFKWAATAKAAPGAQADISRIVEICLVKLRSPTQADKPSIRIVMEGCVPESYDVSFSSGKDLPKEKMNLRIVKMQIYYQELGPDGGAISGRNADAFYDQSTPDGDSGGGA
jgi:hypothetical protein